VRHAETSEPVRLLELNEAARVLGLSPASVRILRLTGQLRPAAVTKRMSLFSAEEVERVRVERATRHARSVPA
jgi:hypothetical protein